MPLFAIYVTATGQIDRVVGAPDAICAQANADAQHSVLAIDAGDDSTHYVVNGALVAFPANPQPGVCTWNWTSLSWVDQRQLADVQAASIAALTSAYQAAIAVNVSFTSAAGVQQTFQADPDSVNVVVQTMLGCQAAQATPSGFFWVAADNTHVPFTYADLQGLAAAIFAQGSAAFSHLQAQKTAVRAATTVSAAAAVTW